MAGSASARPASTNPPFVILRQAAPSRRRPGDPAARVSATLSGARLRPPFRLRRRWVPRSRCARRMMTKERSADRLCVMPTHRTFIATYIVASRREKRLKKWLRDWKLALIETDNPEWRDIAADWYPVNDPNWTPPPEE